jgi:hypothetical protein
MNELYCEHCGASLKKFWHRLTPGLVRALIKFRRAVHEKNRNSLHLYQDLTGENQLTTAEQMNWTKLRFHGLVAKAKEEKHWLITKRGAQFLNGEIEVPKRVQTFRNRVVAHDAEMVFIKNVIGEVPYFESRQDFEFDQADSEDMAEAVIVKSNKKKKKVKHLCPICRTETKIKTEITSTVGNTASFINWRVCPKCEYQERVI